MRRYQSGTSDWDISSVCGNNKQWREVRLNDSVKESKTFEIEEMNFVDEKNTRNDGSLFLFAPFRNLKICFSNQKNGVDLNKLD